MDRILIIDDDTELCAFNAVDGGLVVQITLLD